MMEISNGTEIFSIVKSGAVCYEDSTFPTQLTELQTFYGDADGAATPPKTKLYLSGLRIGVATSQAQKTIGTKVFQNLTTKTEERESGGLFGWGKGDYAEIDKSVWVCIEDITISRTEAETALNERVNAEQIAKDKKLNDILEDDPNKKNLGNGDDGNTSFPWGVVGIIVAFMVGLFFWDKNKKEKKKLASQNQQSTIPQSFYQTKL